MQIIKRFRRSHYLVLAVGFLLGLLSLTAVRFVAYSPDVTHYHANFALYINGKKDDFKSFTFYEEVAACADHNASNVKARTHMHDSKAGLIHVHDEGVTWGQFFANLGYGLTDKAITTDDGVFVSNDTDKLSFILNGTPMTSIANVVIQNEDRLLIDYGTDTEQVLQSMFTSVPEDAVEANSKQDPATCAGSAEPTLKDRLRAAVGLKAGNGH